MPTGFDQAPGDRCPKNAAAGRLPAAMLCVWAAVVLLAISCARVPTTPGLALLPNAPAPTLPALSGEKTPGCDHVLAVLRSLQDYANGVRAYKVSFEFTEAEINEYLAYSLHIKPRSGVRALAVRFLPDNNVSVLALIDFAGVQKWNTWLVPETLRAGLYSERPIQIDLKFKASDGFGTFKLTNVVGPGGAIISNAAMEWIIQAIALHQPEWYNTTRDIQLPFGLQEIWAGKQSLFGAT
jgi:hypothetical protein